MRTVDFSEQAAYVEGSILLSLANGAPDICWYSLQNTEDKQS